MKIKVVHGITRRRNAINNNQILADRLDNLNLSGLDKKRVQTGSGIAGGLLNGVVRKSGIQLGGSFKALGEPKKKSKLKF